MDNINEQNYFDKVLNVIEDNISLINTNIIDDTKVAKELIDDRWNAIKGEQYLDDANDQITLVNIKYNQLNKLRKAYLKPYFARVDFKSEDLLNIYIGITSVTDQKQNIYVYDWRSPVASLYYNYDLGPAKYEANETDYEGIITKKRQYQISNSKLIGYFDTDMNISDTYLQNVLASAKGAKMKNIVDTIQKEQNQVIRNLKDANLIVQGAAGSGKTVIALHRIAYLIYQKQQLNNGNVLIISPNQTFLIYVDNVLPELGEENVDNVTFASLASKYITEFKDLETYIEFIQRVNNSNYDKLIDYKFSMEAQIKLLNKFDNYINNINFDRPIKFRYKKKLYRISHHLIKQLFFNRFAKQDLTTRVNKLIDAICEKYSLDNKIKMFIHEQFYDFYHINTNLIELYNDFMDTNYTKESELCYEDITLFLTLKFKFSSYNVEADILHVVIDEVQDYAIPQLEVIKMMFPRATFTILGDSNQIINPYFKYENLNELSVLFKDSNYVELFNTYRNSKNITKYANQILGINHIVAIRDDHQPEVKELNVENILNDINKLIEENKQLVIIAANEQSAKYLQSELSTIIDIEIATEGDDLNMMTNFIIPVYLAKGLEFEKVVVYNNGDFDNNKSLYYIAVTRAQHELIIIN